MFLVLSEYMYTDRILINTYKITYINNNKYYI